MSKFHIVKVEYSDGSEEFEIRMRMGTITQSSVLITSRSDIESARKAIVFLNGRTEVSREVVE